MPSSSISSYEERQAWRKSYLAADDMLITTMPKVELHVHIEGTMSPELRWKLAQRNNIPLTCGSDKVPLGSVEEVRDAYTKICGRIGAGSADASLSFTFFEIYYGGFELLKNEEDYYDLAMSYFEKASQMNVRYCEPFFDPQGHTRRGIALDVILGGLRRAQIDAERDLNASVILLLIYQRTNSLKVKSQWIMCILRDMSPASAMAQYEAALGFRNMIVGIGLDSDEYERPPTLFKDLFQRARIDGFKITSHCDFNQKDTHEHIRQVVCSIGGSGAERIDHGLNAADQEDLMTMIKEKDIGMTICPCAYIRHTSEEAIFPRIRKLFDSGIKVTIASDDPAYMEDSWLLHNLLMLRNKCQFTDKEMIQLQGNAIATCWASTSLKAALNASLDQFVDSRVRV